MTGGAGTLSASMEDSGPVLIASIPVCTEREREREREGERERERERESCAVHDDFQINKEE